MKTQHIKSSVRTSFVCASLITGISAANLYWDGNSTGTGSADTPTGTWGVDSFWNTDSTGGAGGSFQIGTLSVDDLFFSAGSDAVNAYTVSLNGVTQNARLVTFEDGTVTLNNGTLSLGTGGGLTVTSNTVTGSTISSSLTIAGSQTFNVAAGRTLTLDTGTFTRNANSTLSIQGAGTITSTMTGLDSASLVNGIIGPWASHGSGASTRYATIDGSNNIVAYTAGTAAATAAGVTSTLGTVNYDVAAVGTLGAGANINTLRYTGAAGTIAGALTTNGIMNTSGNTLTFSGAVTAGSSGQLVLNSASGTIAFNAATAAGSYDLVKTGAGRVNLANINTTYSGNVIVNEGVLFYGDSAARLTSGNITLNGGVIEQRWNTGFTKTQGSGAGQIQILGGESGFSQNGNTGYTVNIGAITWGSSTFNPSKLVLQTLTSQGNSSVTISSAINLNGSNRTILANAGVTGNATSTLSGVISNGTGTAGLIKEGPGILILSNSGNTYNGSTTISQGTLRANSTGALGNSSATNTLIFNGGTLQAGGTITSAATRSVTMNSTGIINTNNQAVSIAGNISGAGGLTKNGNGTLTLSGTNNYGGTTTVNAGTLAIAKEVSLASNTAANLNVKNGATLALNVDSAGTAGFSTSNLDTLLANISVANTTAQGLQAGAILGINTATATGATFAPTSAITNSTGASGGSIGLNKLGAGTLVLDQANTYTGQTTITTGTLQLGSGTAAGSLSTSSPISIGSGATFAVNQTDTVTQGADFGTSITGAGSLANVGSGSLVLNALNFHTGNTTATAGNITLNHASAIQFSALNTTGAGTVTLSGVTAPIFGGLEDSGTTRNLADVITTGYADVTNLTLNPQSGSTFTYGGVIADGAAGMDLTKTGVGTQILQGANTYTGETFLNAGTLTLSGATGALTGTTGITFNGGGLTLTNADNDTEDGLDRVNDSAAITSNGGTITYSNTTAGSTRTFIETLGSVALSSGQLNLVNTLDKTAGSQTLALSGLTRTGASNTSAISFSNAGGLNLTNDRIRVNGITTDTAANQIIGAWATVGTAANSQTDYAVYDSDGSDGYIVARNTAGSTQDTWTTAGNAYTNALAAQTLTGTRTITALRNTGTTATLTLASGVNLETSGVLNGAATLLTIAPGTGGVLTTSTGGGGLYLTTHGVNSNTSGAHHGISVTAPINDNGGAVTLVKSGVGVLQLNATSNYSGGTVLNSGTLWAQSDASLGNVNGDITFNGSATLLLSPNNGTSSLSFNLPSTRSIIVNEGAMATIAGGRANAAITINGDISGSGGVTTGRVALLSNGGIGTLYHHLLLGNNTFTGAFNVGNGLETAAGGGTLGVTINSLADSTSPITLNFGSNNAFFSLGAGASVDLSVPNRLVDLRNSNITIRNQNATRTMTLGSITTTTTGNKELKLGDGGAGGFISGAITNGAGSLSVTKSGTGTWNISGTNTYTGATTISGGTLQIGGSGRLGGGNYYGNISIASTNSGRLVYNSTANQTFSGVISGAGALVKNNTGNLTLTNTNTLTGATTISGGVLAINGAGTINSSAVTINGGDFRYNSSTNYTGALTFTSGTISGTNWGGSLDNLTIGANRTVSPGNSPGAASVGGQTWAAGGSYEWEINSTLGSAGLDPGWDLINGTGTLNITASAGNEFTIDVMSLTLGNVAGAVSDFNEALSYNWMIANFNTITGFSADAFAVDTTQFTLHNTFTGAFEIALGNTGSIGGTDSQIFLTYTAIPEPKAALLGALGVLLLFRRRR